MHAGFLIFLHKMLLVPGIVTIVCGGVKLEISKINPINPAKT